MNETTVKDYLDLLNPKFLKNEFNLSWWQVALLWPWIFIFVLLASILMIIVYIMLIVVLICLIPFLPFALIIHAFFPEKLR